MCRCAGSPFTQTAPPPSAAPMHPPWQRQSTWQLATQGWQAQQFLSLNSRLLCGTAAGQFTPLASSRTTKTQGALRVDSMTHPTRAQGMAAFSPVSAGPGSASMFGLRSLFPPQFLGSSGLCATVCRCVMHSASMPSPNPPNRFTLHPAKPRMFCRVQASFVYRGPRLPYLGFRPSASAPGGTVLYISFCCNVERTLPFVRLCIVGVTPADTRHIWLK